MKTKSIFAMSIFSTLLLCFSCSTMPKNSKAVVSIKNNAAEYSGMADSFLFEGKYSFALQYYGEALNSALSVDDTGAAIKARNSLGRVFLEIKQLADAEREFSDALIDARNSGDQVLIALSLSNLGELNYAQGDYQKAESLFIESESIITSKPTSSKPGASEVASLVFHNRGVTAMAMDRLDEAEAFFAKAIAGNEKNMRWSELGSNCYSMASLCNKRGALATAIVWAEKALAADKMSENSVGIGADLDALSRLYERNGNLEKSFDYRRRSFGVWLSINREKEAKASLEALVRLASSLSYDKLASRYSQQLALFEEPEK